MEKTLFDWIIILLEEYGPYFWKGTLVTLEALHGSRLNPRNRMGLSLPRRPQTPPAASPSLRLAPHCPFVGAFEHADFVDTGREPAPQSLFATRAHLAARAPSDVTQFTRHRYAAKRGTHAAMGSTASFCGGFGQILAPS